MEELLRRIKVEIVGNYRNFVPSLGVTADGTWEVQILDKFESFMGPLECPIDREEVKLEEAVLCPICMTPYHLDCARLLASRREKCWKCDRFERFDLLVT